jgi:hypothetical protein
MDKAEVEEWTKQEEWTRQVEKELATRQNGIDCLLTPGRFLGVVRQRSACKCGSHQNSTPASAISTRYRVRARDLAFRDSGHHLCIT